MHSSISFGGRVVAASAVSICRDGVRRQPRDHKELHLWSSLRCGHLSIDHPTSSRTCGQEDLSTGLDTFVHSPTSRRYRIIRIGLARMVRTGCCPATPFRRRLA